MTPEKVASFVIGLGGDASELDKVFGNVVSKVDRTVATIQRAADKLDLFRTISDNLPKVQTALDSAKAKVVEYGTAIEKAQAAGGKVPKELIDGLKQAEAAAAAATKELARQQQQLATLDAQLTRAGVNTRNLAAEQIRLAEASAAASKAAEVQAAKQTLGVVTLKDTEAQAAKLRAAFDTLKASGTLSASEIAIAQSRLNAELKALGATVTKVGGGVKTLGGDLKEAFTAVGGPALAAVGGIAAVTSALSACIAAAKEYRNVLIEASAGTDLTREAATALGREAQKLAAELGQDVNATVKELFSLLKAGVPESNVLEVLRVSSEAAKASLSDVGSGVKIAKLFLNDLKLPADQLGHAFDVLKVTVGGSKEGFEAFANAGGPLLAVAKASNIGLEDLAATLRALTKSGIDAGDAITATQKIIVELASPEARQRLQEYGVTATDLVGLFTQLNERGVRLQDVLDLTGVSKRAASAVAALINDTKRLNDAFARTTTAGGAVEKQNAKLYDTPREISDRFHATLDITKQKLGELAGAGGRATTIVTYLLDKFNNLAAQATIIDEFEARKQQAFDRSAEALLREAAAALGLTTSQEAAKKALDEYAAKEEAAAHATETHNAAIQTQRDALEPLAAALLKNAQALEAVVAAELKTTEEGAQRQIAAIELAAGARRRASDEQLRAAEQARVAAGVIQIAGEREITIINRAAEARTQAGISAKEAAAQTLAVQQEAAEKELAILNDKVAKIRAAEDAAFAARVKAAGSSQFGLQKAADDELAIRTKSTQAILGLYQSLYDRLAKEARAGQDKVQSIDAERITFAEQIELKLRTLRQDTITASESYAQTLRDIDVATSKARQALAEGDFKVGKQYTDQAIQLAESLSKVTDDEGRVVVSNLEVQQAKIRAIKTAADQYKDALEEQGDAAKAGSDKAIEEMQQIEPVLETLQKQLADFRAKLAENIDKKIKIDLDGVDQAQDIIRELVKPQTKVITIRTVREGGGEPTFTPTGPLESGVPFARGGPVAPWRSYQPRVQHFADGGPAFRRPTWSKVPGIGNADTQPALLQEGAFVVRKAASRYYGDATMGRLVRGYAGGGYVGGLTFDTKGAITQQAVEVKDLLKGKISDPNQLKKIGEYFSSLPPGTQTELVNDLQSGGTDALIAANQIEEGQAAQARGAAKPIAPDDVSPPPNATDAINYAKYVDSHLRFGNVFDLVKRQLGTFINQVQRDPNNQALIQAMIRTARASASNLYLQDFHVGTGFGALIPNKVPQLRDWYDFIAQQPKQSTNSPFRNFSDAFNKPTYGNFAAGGSVGTDTVPAMLTPGEHVVQAPRVRELGGDFMHAVNDMRIAPLDLARMLAPPPLRLATGGPVGYVPNTPGTADNTRSWPGDTAIGSNINLTVNVNGANLDFDDPRLQRRIGSAMTDLARRSGLSST